ncbi:MAG: hypothetical protein Q8M01_13755 [Rubrivivax sp.]|nr:hypothetical protein [Rubrivivax sp.]
MTTLPFAGAGACRPQAAARSWPRRLLLTAAVILATSWLFAGADSFRFNQFDIARQDASHRVNDPRRVAQTWLVSGWWRGAGHIARLGRSGDADFGDSDSLLRLVLDHVPRHARVYPGGGYYYFSAAVGGQALRGHLGLRDAGRGLLHLYLRRGDGPHTESRHRVFGAADGVQVQTTGADRVRVRHGGVSRHFTLHAHARAGAPPPPLDEAETWLSAVADESGLHFHLIFDTSDRGFRYLLDESAGVAERFDTLAPGLLRGRRTGFVFHQEASPARKLLVAVSRTGDKRPYSKPKAVGQVPLDMQPLFRAIARR